eukprot:scaffold212094_cov40-Tisochrysis_lutea.AAC.7
MGGCDGWRSEVCRARLELDGMWVSSANPPERMYREHRAPRGYVLGEDGAPRLSHRPDDGSMPGGGWETNGERRKKRGREGEQGEEEDRPM